MRKYLLLLFIITIAPAIAFSQTTIHTEDFETTGGYNTSTAEFSGGATDYFTRTDGTNIAGSVEFNNIQGTYYFAAQDIDGEGATLPVTLDIDDIDISGFTNLTFKVFLAEDDDGTNQDWDSSDFVKFNYDIDNSGTFSDLLHIQNDGITI